LKKHVEDHPEFADMDESSSAAADGLSTAGVSGAESVAQPKIKLTFNSNRDSASAANGDILSDEE
jgi:ATP-dependent helicase STH1/SNF2